MMHYLQWDTEIPVPGPSSQCTDPRVLVLFLHMTNELLPCQYYSYGKLKIYLVHPLSNYCPVFSFINVAWEKGKVIFFFFFCYCFHVSSNRCRERAKRFFVFVFFFMCRFWGYSLGWAYYKPITKARFTTFGKMVDLYVTYFCKVTALNQLQPTENRPHNLLIILENSPCYFPLLETDSTN